MNADNIIYIETIKGGPTMERYLFTNELPLPKGFTEVKFYPPMPRHFFRKIGTSKDSVGIPVYQAQSDRWQVIVHNRYICDVKEEIWNATLKVAPTTPLSAYKVCELLTTCILNTNIEGTLARATLHGYGIDVEMLDKTPYTFLSIGQLAEAVKPMAEKMSEATKALKKLAVGGLVVDLSPLAYEWPSVSAGTFITQALESYRDSKGTLRINRGPQIVTSAVIEGSFLDKVWIDEAESLKWLKVDRDKWDAEYLGKWDNETNKTQGVNEMAFDVNRLMEEKVWKTSDNRKVNIKDMENDHLINTILYLEKTAVLYKNQFDFDIAKEESCLTSTKGKINYFLGNDCCMYNVQRALWAQDEHTWMESTPIYKEMVAEVSKRGLTDLLCIIRERNERNGLGARTKA